MSPHSETLKNGLRVVYVPCEAESVAFGLFISSGSRYEEARVAGISHFIEHMLFKGTPTRRPIDITRAIEGRGGNFNAFTGEEATCYYAHLPDEYLNEAVEILGDMYLNASMPDDEFAREKQVVIEEIRMYADEPDAVAMENLQRSLFPCNPVGAPVAGSAASLSPLKPTDLKRYARSHYLPQNTVAVIAGHFDESAAHDVLVRTFGRFRAGRHTVPAIVPVDFSVPPVAEVSVTKDVNQAQLALGYRSFGIHDPRKYAATVMDAILGRGMSSRLFQEVREKRGLSYDISSRMQFFEDAGMFTVSAGLDRTKTAKALSTIDRELMRIRTKRVSAAELNRVKEFLIGNFKLSHEKVTSKLFFYGATMSSFGRLVMPREQVEGIAAVSAADVQEVANEILKPENRSISWVLPR